jgi:class 3 adenylate cyclase
MLRGTEQAPSGAVVVSVGAEALQDLQSRLADDAALVGALDRCATAGFGAELMQVRGPGETPRRLYACLLSHLAGADAAAIVMDIHFLRPGDASEDAVLARALAEAGNVYLLEHVEIFDNGARQRTPPLATFRDRAAGTGHFVIAHEGGRPAGYVARMAGFEDICPLPLATTACKTLPVSEGSIVPLWLYGPAGTVPSVGMADILAGTGRQGFAGAVLFIGAASGGRMGLDTFPDAWPGAGPDSISGVELLATAYLNSRDGGPPRALPAAAFAAVLALQGAAFGAAASATRWRWAAIALLALALSATGALAFAKLRLLLPVATPLLLLAPMAVGLGVLLNNARMQALVRRLVPPVAADIVLGREALKAGLRPCVAVALDMAGSTAFQAEHGAERFGERQRALYAMFSECLAAQGGHVIKYTGDGAMAVFFAEAGGRPEPLATAADKALRAFAERWRALAEEQRARGEPAIAVRIGMEAGEAQLSITETADRLIVDAAGEPLNVAARLEAFAKTVAGDGLVTVVAGGSLVGLICQKVYDWAPLGAQSLQGIIGPQHCFVLLPRQFV